MRLKGKTALVTGASRGIGRAIALRLAAEGCTVGIHYRNQHEEAAAVQAAIEAAGGKALLLPADLADLDQVEALAEEAWNQLGGLDYLINNAGISFKKHFLDVTPADTEAFLRVNYQAPFRLAQLVARKMIEAGREGCISSITSVNGLRPNFGQSAYGASKSALETAMMGAALELAVHNIRVNTFAVGAVETDMTAPVLADPAAYQEVIAGIPQGRFGLPEEVAAVVVDLLASGSYVTGASLTIDGGLLLMRGYGKTAPYS